MGPVETHRGVMTGDIRAVGLKSKSQPLLAVQPIMCELLSLTPLLLQRLATFVAASDRIPRTTLPKFRQSSFRLP